MGAAVKGIGVSSCCWSTRVFLEFLCFLYLHHLNVSKMDSFGSDYSAGGSGGKIDTGTIMEQVKVQIAVANAQELLQRMTDKCFKKCIGKPGSSLDNSEQKCIAMCMDRYMDAWNTVSRTYNSRLQRERARMWDIMNRSWIQVVWWTIQLHCVLLRQELYHTCSFGTEGSAWTSP